MLLLIWAVNVSGFKLPNRPLRRALILERHVYSHRHRHGGQTECRGSGVQWLVSNCSWSGRRSDRLCHDPTAVSFSRQVRGFVVTTIVALLEKNALITALLWWR